MRMRLESGGFTNAKFRIREFVVHDGVNPAGTIIAPANPTDWTSVALGDITKTPMINFAIPNPSANS